VLDEFVIYDQDRDVIHRLNPISARIWRLCDGRTTPAEIASALCANVDHPVEESLVWFGLSRLGRAHLLTEPVQLPEEIVVRSRRGVLRNMARAGAGVVLLPTVVSLLAPTPAEAGNSDFSGCKQFCGADSECKSPCSACVPVMIGGSIKTCI
jgi:hypothetical protein